MEFSVEGNNHDCGIYFPDLINLNNQVQQSTPLSVVILIMNAIQVTHFLIIKKKISQKIRVLYKTFNRDDNLSLL